jgi:hypothetical protein
MNIYLLTQDVNNGYDTFDSVVVVASTKEKARMIHPSKGVGWDGKRESYSPWVRVEDVCVKYLGRATKGIKQGVLLGSFNAG